MTRRQLLAALSAAGLPVAALAQQLPRPAGEIEFVSHTGERIKLSSLKGKVVAVEVLLTTCPGCQRSATALSKLQTEYRARGFQVIGLAINEGAGPQLPGFTNSYAKTFPVGVYPQEKAFAFLQHSVMSRVLMPQVAFVDRAGNVREQHGGSDAFFNDEEKSMRAVIEKLLKEPGGAATKSAPKSASKKKS